MSIRRDRERGQILRCDDCGAELTDRVGAVGWVRDAEAACHTCPRCGVRDWFFLAAMGTGPVSVRTLERRTEQRWRVLPSETRRWLASALHRGRVQPIPAAGGRVRFTATRRMPVVPSPVSRAAESAVLLEATPA